MVSEPTETVAPAAHLFARRVQSLAQMSQQEVWDEEDLHQFRITLRTLLAWHPLWAITQLSRSGCQHEEYLKKLIGQCNRQRDRDVFAAYLVPLPHSRRLRQQLRQKTAYRKPSMAELSSLLGQVQRQLTTWQLRMTPTLLQEQLALLLQLYLVRTIRLVTKSQQGSLCELHRLRLRLKSLLPARNTSCRGSAVASAEHGLSQLAGAARPVCRSGWLVALAQAATREKISGHLAPPPSTAGATAARRTRRADATTRPD